MWNICAWTDSFLGQCQNERNKCILLASNSSRYSAKWRDLHSSAFSKNSHQVSLVTPNGHQLQRKYNILEQKILIFFIHVHLLMRNLFFYYLWFNDYTDMSLFFFKYVQISQLTWLQSHKEKLLAYLFT